MQMRENTDQNNSEYGHLLRSVCQKDQSSQDSVLTNFCTELNLMTLTNRQLDVLIIFRSSLKSSWFSLHKNEIFH